jgi:uncharacterized protein (DUF3820 family)/DNA-directed RNA polymerase subunit RPC12/RpoP
MISMFRRPGYRSRRKWRTHPRPTRRRKKSTNNKTNSKRRPNSRCVSCGDKTYATRAELARAAGVRCTACGGTVVLKRYAPPPPSKPPTAPTSPKPSGNTGQDQSAHLHLAQSVIEPADAVAEFMRLVNCEASEVRDIADTPPPITISYRIERFGQAKMPFGQHAGELIFDIPRPYLQWLASTESTTAKVKKFKATLSQWLDANPSEHAPQDDLSREYRSIVGRESA